MPNSISLSEIKECSMSDPYIFISYSSIDQEIVYQDILELQKTYNIWLDEKNLNKTNPSWREYVRTMLRSDPDCAGVIFYVSQYSLTSRNCYDEIYTAIKDPDTIRLHFGPIPLLCIDLEGPGDITKKAIQYHTEILSDRLLSKEERCIQSRTLYDFTTEIFNFNNDRIRMPSRELFASRPGEAESSSSLYYDELKRHLPKEASFYEIENAALITGLIRKAETPNDYAQTLLGQLYHDGSLSLQKLETLNNFLPAPKLVKDHLTADRSFERSARWYQKAAQKDNPLALYFLAICYLEGKGVPKNVKKGVELLEKAADEQHLDSYAQYRLSLMYETGEVVEKDEEKARRYCELSKNQGNPSAVFHWKKRYETTSQ